MPYQNDAGYAGGLGFGKNPALLVVDMIKAYTRPESPFYAPGYGAVAETIAGLVRAAREKGLPVIFTTLSYDAHFLTGGHFVRKIPALQLIRTRPEYAEIVEGLAPRDGEPVLTKQYASAFHGTSLLALLNYRRIDSLLISGVSTSGCIRATATDAIQYGLIPMVVCDAVGDRTAQVHEANLFDLQAKYADLYTVQEVLGHLTTNNQQRPTNNDFT
jgi:nicotinamidase-related amidase